MKTLTLSRTELPSSGTAVKEITRLMEAVAPKFGPFLEVATVFCPMLPGVRDFLHQSGLRQMRSMPKKRREPKRRPSRRKRRGSRQLKEPVGC